MSRPVLLLAAAALGLAACEQPRQASTARLYYVDQQGGARGCTTAPATAPNRPLTVSGGTEAQMTVVNDGGWCGVTVQRPGGGRFSAGLVSARPANGRLHVRAVGDTTRVDYYPDAGFAGSDTFAVNMVPGGAQLRVAVTVQPGPASAAAAAPTPAAAAAPVVAGRRAAPASRTTRTPARR